VRCVRAAFVLLLLLLLLLLLIILIIIITRPHPARHAAWRWSVGRLGITYVLAHWLCY
jgi:uncharacterized membrane protein YdcZ (DUF606 family)